MNLIPEKFVEEAVKKITKNYKVSEEQAQEFFLDEAVKNKKFMVNALEFSEKKNFIKWKEFNKVLKKAKKNIYVFLRQYKQEGKEKIQEKLNELKETLKKKKLENTLELHKELLSMHVSSRERIEFYEEFYEKIFEVTGKPKTVLDVSTGFNYFSVPLMKLKELFFVGTEHKEESVEKINEYFSLISNSGIKGKGFLLDLRETDFDTRNELLDLNKDKQFDAAFLLKLIPVIEREKKGLTKNLINLIPAEWIILSASKESMTKKQDISFREKTTMNKFIKENGLYLVKKIEFSNEIVFITKKE